ncbi:hypothetical protein ACLK11_06915 [Escherichia coli]
MLRCNGHLVGCTHINDQIAREVDLAVDNGINSLAPAAPVIAKLSPVILPPAERPQTQRQTAITINCNIGILHVDNSRCRLAEAP